MILFKYKNRKVLMSCAVLKRLLNISPVFLDLSDPYPGHGGRNSGTFFPTRVMVLSMPPRGTDKRASTQNVLPAMHQVSVVVGNIRKLLPVPPPTTPEFHLPAPQFTWV